MNKEDIDWLVDGYKIILMFSIIDLSIIIIGILKKEWIVVLVILCCGYIKLFIGLVVILDNNKCRNRRKGYATR